MIWQYYMCTLALYYGIQASGTFFLLERLSLYLYFEILFVLHQPEGSRFTHSNFGEEAEVMEGWTHPPLAQGMEQDIVGRATLVTMELVKQAVTLVKLVCILCGGGAGFNNIHVPLISIRL